MFSTAKESKNKPTKKTIPILFKVIAVFIVITAAVIISTILYNYYNYSNLISPTHYPITSTILYNYYNYSNLISPTHYPITNLNHYSSVDKFGIKEIYPTKIGGEEWFMNMNDITHDPRTVFTASIPTITKNPDGSWKVSYPEVQYNIFTFSVYHPNLITTLNHKQLSEKGYMQSHNDWKNVEITAYLKLDNQGGYITGASGGLLGVELVSDFER